MAGSKLNKDTLNLWFQTQLCTFQYTCSILHIVPCKLEYFIQIYLLLQSGASILGMRFATPQSLGRRSWGLQGVVDGSWNNYYSLSKFAWKQSNFLCEIAWKIRHFRKFAWKFDFFTRIHDSPDFKPDWRHWL